VSATRRRQRNLKRQLERQMAHVADLSAIQLREMRTLYPDDDYAARLYWCEFCATYDSAVAPRAELIDFYACPACGMPSRGLGPAR